MLRLFCSAALSAVALAGIVAGTPARADRENQPVIRAQGNPYLVDYMITASKRADLRISIPRNGIDYAFSRWLAREYPDAYRRATK